MRSSEEVVFTIIWFLSAPSCPLWFRVLLFRSPDVSMTRCPDCLPQLQHLQRTIRPVVFPAHNHVAAFHVVQMHQKILALIFQFNSHHLAAFVVHPAQGDAVRKFRLYLQRGISQLPRHRRKQEHYSGFIRRGVHHRRRQQRRSKDGRVGQHSRSRCRSQRRSQRDSRPPPALRMPGNDLQYVTPLSFQPFFSGVFSRHCGTLFQVLNRVISGRALNFPRSSNSAIVGILPSLRTVPAPFLK